MPRKKPARKNPWLELNRRMKGLPQASFDHAMKYELPYSPGIDMDAIYKSRPARVADTTGASR